MKSFYFLRLSTSTVAAALLLSACGKSEPAATPAANATTAAAKSLATAPVAPPTPAAAKPPAGAQEFGIKWAAGKKLRFRMEQTQDSETSVPGLTEPMVQTTTSAVEYSLTAVMAQPDGGWELEMEFLRQEIDSKMGKTGLLSFDSAKPVAEDKDPNAALFRRLVGSRIKCLTDAHGKVREVEKFDAFLQSVAGTGGPTGAATLQSLYSQDSLKELCSVADSLPDHAVKPGDSWNSRRTMDAPPLGKLNVDQTFTFSAWETHNGRLCAALDYAGSITSSGEVGAVKGMTIKLENGTTAGKAWYDFARGEIVENQDQHTLGLKMSAAGQDLGTKIKGHGSLKLLDAAALAK